MLTTGKIYNALIGEGAEKMYAYKQNMLITGMLISGKGSH